MEILENLIGQGGDIIFVIDSPISKNVFYNSNSLNDIKWKRGGLSKFKVDLVFLNNIGKEKLIERQKIPNSQPVAPVAQRYLVTL